MWQQSPCYPFDYTGPTSLHFKDVLWIMQHPDPQRSHHLSMVDLTSILLLTYLSMQLTRRLKTLKGLNEHTTNIGNIECRSAPLYIKVWAMISKTELIKTQEPFSTRIMEKRELYGTSLKQSFKESDTQMRWPTSPIFISSRLIHQTTWSQLIATLSTTCQLSRRDILLLQISQDFGKISRPIALSKL